MKIVITGGHFSPAYSVIKKLRSGNDVVVVGRKYAFEGEKNETLEYKLCQKDDIPFVSIKAGRLQRVITKHSIPSLVRFPKGIYQAIKILRKEKSDVVLTFGGYIGLTVAFGAFILRIPVVLHEQTQKAGLSSRLISRFAKVVCISFQSSEKFFSGKKVVFTGNPIREEIFNYKDMDIPTNDPILFVTGGSTGAHIINESVLQILEKLLENYIVVHQTGNAAQYDDYKRIIERREALNEKIKKKYFVREFFEPQEVGWLLNNSSLVLARSGANTISELLAVGTPSLLIPLPHGQSNEQLENAKLLKNTGLGEIIEQDNLNSKNLLMTISDMIKNKEDYAKNRMNAAELIRKDAAEKIIEQVFYYGRKGKQGFFDTSN